jgi:hypothetical protein
MLEARTQGNPETNEDIQAVLKELGSPLELADKYRDKSHFLIGPEIFPVYLLIMKIVLAATFLGLTIVIVLDLLTSSDMIWYEYLFKWLSSIISGSFMSFAWVTIIFAIFEWRGVNLKEFLPNWEVSSLPPVPEYEMNIPLWEPIAGIVFTIICMIIFLLSPQLIGVYYITESMKTTIPIFDLTVLRTVLPLFLICMGLGLLKNIWEIVDRRYSIKYAIITFIVNTIEIILTIIIFTRFPIWNKDFITELNSLFDLGSDAVLTTLWNILTSNMIIFLVLIYLIDTITTIYNSLKHENKSIFNK